VQIVHGSRRGARSIEHVGSAHDEAELEALKAAARQRLAGVQAELDLELDLDPEASASVATGPAGSAGRPLEIASSRMGHLWNGLSSADDALGFDRTAGGDEVFRQLVLARIIEPTSKADSLRALGEVGVDAVSYPTLNRHLPCYAVEGFRRKLAGACARHARLGPASLVLYDVSTLYFETDAGDGFREPGFSKERRLEPQITIGSLTDAAGFPLMVEAFEGNAAETATMLPSIRAFMAAHQLADLTIVADAGMISDTNKKAIEAAGLSFILGMRIPEVPYVVTERLREHPDEPMPDGLILTQPWPAGPADKRRDQVIYYQYKADRARRTLHWIRRAGRQGRAGGGRQGTGQAQPVRQVGRRRQVGEPRAGGQGAGAGRVEGYITNCPTPPRSS
jgi:hypothetical protein